MKNALNRKILIPALLVFVATIAVIVFQQSFAIVEPFNAPPSFQADPMPEMPNNIIVPDNGNSAIVGVPNLTANGQTLRVYCIEVFLDFCYGQQYTRTTENLDLGLSYILRQGHHSPSFATQTEREAIWVTQMAIYMYISTADTTTRYGQANINSSRASRPDLWTRVDNLVTRANEVQAAGIPFTAVSMNLNPDFTVNGNYFETNLVTVTGTATPADRFLRYSIALTGAPAGVQIVNASGLPIANINNVAVGTQFRVRVPIANAPTGTIRVTVTGIFRDYRAWNYVRAGECQSVVLVEPIERERPVYRDVRFPTGSLEIRKVDPENNNVQLPGARIRVTNVATGAVVEEFVTTGSPHRINNLPFGVYEVVETEAPPGFIFNPIPQRITIDRATAAHVFQARIENRESAIRIGKTDAITGTYIAGATLQLCTGPFIIADSGASSYHPEYCIAWETTASPRVFRGLFVGREYVLTELYAPPGYIRSTASVRFVVTEAGTQIVNLSTEHIILSITNRRLSIDTQGVAGYVFSLERRGGPIIGNITTTSEVYTTEQLPVGDYILREIAVPEGRVRNHGIYTFSVTETGETNEIRFSNDFTRVLISKRDITNAEELPGARIVISDCDGNVIEEWVSRDEPHLIERLPVGCYILEETIAPPGFALKTETIEFHVLETGEIQGAHMYNEPEQVRIPDTLATVSMTVLIVGSIFIIVGGAVISINAKKTKLQKIEK